MRKSKRGKTLLNGEELALPCGTVWYTVTPENGAKWSKRFPGGDMLTNISAHYTYDAPFPLQSASADPLKIIAHGTVHVEYFT